jgi:hypothetical protein
MAGPRACLAHSGAWPGLIALAAVGCSRAALETPGPPPRQALREEPAPPPAPGGLQASGPRFVRAPSSDAWVKATFAVQPGDGRVLLVGAGAAPLRVRVPRPALDARRALGDAAPAAELVDLPVAATFASLQEAADAAEGGDVVAVMPGRYAGFSLEGKATAGDGRYLRFRALGAPGEVTIERPSPRHREWFVYLRAAHHVILEGFHLAGDGRARAGIMLDGDFGQTGRLLHHVALLGNYAHHFRRWGMHATDTHTVLVQDSVFAHSAEEHSAYVSDGSDNWVLRRNVFFRSHASGLQINLDPVASLDTLREHPAFASWPDGPPTRRWAAALLAEATRKFGEHGFPDGRGVGFIVEDNVVYGHGTGGAAALNLAGLSDSLIQNNIVYGNVAGGIAQWDDGNPFDAEAVKPDASGAPTEAAAPEAEVLFGCRNNIVRSNTVLMNKAGRFALQSRHGSTGTRAVNNVLINDAPSSIEVDHASITGFDGRHNVVHQVAYDEVAPERRKLAKSPPDGALNRAGITRARFAAEVVRYGEEPWLVLEGSWFRVNPARPDFRPRPGSALLAGRGDAAELPPHDFSGRARRAADIGALAP